jgi:LysR family transcriptional regulator, hydrogen peroxide-inducible genes activator
MTLTQLSYIVALDKFKNFGHAADSCKITQPTLSMQIQKLEDELGLILFDRSSQPIKPTKMGQILISQARVILNESQKFSDLVQEDKGEVKGEVTLGVIPTLAPYLLPLFLKKFSEKHPALQINIEELQTHQILDRLKNNTLDIAILVTPIDDEKLLSTPLFYEPFLIYTSEKNNLYSKNKISQTELSQNEMWMLTEGHCFRDQTLAVCKSKKKSADEKKNIKFESGSLETLRRMVDLENGFTLIPYLAALDFSNTKKIKEFANPVPTREVSLIHSTFFKRDALKNSLVEVIQKSLPKEIPHLQTKNLQVIDLPFGKTT